MKKTLLLSVTLLSSATAFGMQKVRDCAKQCAQHPYANLVAAGSVTALAQNVKELHPKVTAANAKVAEVLKVDNQAIAQTAAVEVLCLLASRYAGTQAVAGLSVNNVVHAVRGVNYANFVANSGHLDLVVNKLPEAHRNKARAVVGAAATAALYVAAAKALDVVNPDRVTDRKAAAADAATQAAKATKYDAAVAAAKAGQAAMDVATNAAAVAAALAE